MINYERFHFASPPRTATTWFAHAAVACGLGPPNFAKHEPPPKGWHGFLVTFVRHPVNWSVSVYTALRGGMIGVPAVDAVADVARTSRDVYEFLEQIAQRPGIIERAFAAYRASSVMRVEDLPWNVVEFFLSVGVPDNKARGIVDIPRQNALKRDALSNIPRRYRAMICESEKEFCERYEYAD